MVEQSRWKEETLEMRGKTEIWDKGDKNYMWIRVKRA